MYALNDIIEIKKLKKLSNITKEEVLDAFKIHSEMLVTKCNKCHDGFTGADFNTILIEMGYNPISIIDWNDSYAYDTSGFDYIMDLFENDEEIFNAFKTYASKFYSIKK